jgi:DEAD/DEAH box helicase domain-containing protein
MSFWQRVGRAGRNEHGLVIFLPVAQNILDDFTGGTRQLLSGQVESAAFNPQYPTILSKHLECGCVESGVPLALVTSRFGQAAGAIADSLLDQNKLYLSRNNQLWGKGYPHKMSVSGVVVKMQFRCSIRTVVRQSKKCLWLWLNESFSPVLSIWCKMQRRVSSLPFGEFRPRAKISSLEALGQDNNLFTQSEAQLDIQLISKLAEPKIVPTAIPEARLRLTLAWERLQLWSLVTSSWFEHM